jgi:hypothetical protein
MRVKVLENISPYWNYGIVALAKGEEVSGELAAYLASTRSEVEPLDADAQALYDGDAEQEPDAPEHPDGDELDVDGTAADVLAWVGDNPERAKQALDAEQAKDKPRSTLVKQLEKLAEQD